MSIKNSIYNLYEQSSMLLELKEIEHIHVDFSDVEREYGISLSDDIKELMGSYYHSTIIGEYEGNLIYLHSTIRDPEPLFDFKRVLRSYYNTLPDREYVPIGSDEDGNPIIVNNCSGEVLRENMDMVLYSDFAIDDPELRIKIAPSIKHMLDNMTLIVY